MNPRLVSLHQAMAEAAQTAPGEVNDGLYLLRAHRNLAGIVLCCRRLTELIKDHDFLKDSPGLPRYDDRLRILRQIGELDGVDPHFLAGSISHNRIKETPLRPYTGDSGLCDLLLLAPGHAATDEQRKDYAWLQAWFAWQVFHYQLRIEARLRFDQYLMPEADTSVRLTVGHGSRVYGAFRFMRQFADPTNAARARALVTWLGEASEAASTSRAYVLGVVVTSRRSAAHWPRRLAKLGVQAEEVERLVSQARDLHDRLGSSAEAGSGSSLSLLSLFLQSIWSSTVVESRRVPDALGRRLRREARQLDVQRYGSLTAVPHRVEASGSDAGVLVDLYVDRPSRADDEFDLQRPEDADSDDQATEPVIQLFLGDGNPVGAWYASKSAAHHIEAHNALLRWPSWRLSEASIRRLRQIIERDTSPPSAVTDQAKLALGISLLTGRRVANAHAVIVIEGEVPEDALAITPHDYVLHLPVARPQLKRADFSPTPLPKYCLPWASTLRLPIPQAWRDLVDRVRLTRAPKPRQDAVERECKRLLSELPAEWAITTKAISSALRLALLERGRDDLSLVKMVTDASEANFENLIHYASYPRELVERAWGKIVSSWVGPMASLPVADATTGTCVGAPFPISAEKVARTICELKIRLHQALAATRWAEVHNLLTVYLSLWLGLATAGRRSREPVPTWISADGWALVRDKSRPDRSTDRFVPLGPKVREQIEVLRGLTEALGILDPAFWYIGADQAKGLPLRTYLDGKSVPFQPLHWDKVECVEGLPRNWGRRLVRSLSPELVGRLKDAGLGHWVRGRHPWAWTSTFPAGEFAHQWSEMQSRLETALGFEVLKIPQLVSLSAVRAMAPSRQPEALAQEVTKSDLSDDMIDTLLRLSSKHQEYEAVFVTSPPIPQAARWLVARALSERCENVGTLSIYDAEAVCRYVRQKTRIPLFALRPRARFQRNWLVSSEEFEASVYIEQALMPRIDVDLGSLPAVEADVRVRIGRVMVAAALRASVLNGQHLSVLLEFLQGSRPIEAVGEAWLIELTVKSKRTPGPMRRTLLLEPYLAALLVVEREALRGKALAACSFSWATQQREVCFRAYLKSLGLPAGLTLVAFLGGLRQRLLLRSAPILAAYASGEVFTHDLPVSEFRRLAGFDPWPASSLGDEGGGELQRTAAVARADHKVVAFSDEENSEAMPADLRDRDVNLAVSLSHRRSPLLCEWLRLTREKLRASKSRAERLLCGFALDLLDGDQVDARALRNSLVSKRLRRQVARNLEVVWAGLSRFSRDDAALERIDGPALRALMAMSADHFPSRAHRAAWSRFRTFLLGERARVLGHAAVEDIELPDDFVSAKVLSGAEIDRIRQLLESVQSGIATEANRKAAQLHFELARASGARRSEIELLRWVDVDGDMLRIREYEGHTLKTAASRRSLPLKLVNQDRWRALEARRSNVHVKVLETAAGEVVQSSNYYDQLAKAIKQATGDAELGLHHLRHTKASLLGLRMLGNVVSLPMLDRELPWLPSSLPPESEVQVLLGSAGQSGQGMKAVSALLGHLHETTTLHHYVHTLGIALHAHQLGEARIGLPGAFRNRLAGGSSLYRYQRRYRDEGRADSETERYLRDDIVALVSRQPPRDGSSVDASVDSVAPVRRDDTPLRRGSNLHFSGEVHDAAQRMLAWFESLQNRVKEAEVESGSECWAVRHRLRQLAAIPSGKRGALDKRGMRLRRHPLPLTAPDGTPLPRPLLAGLPVNYACVLIAWLLKLKQHSRSDFDWLLDRWQNASHSLSGAVRLTQPGGYERADKLLSDPAIQLTIKPIVDTASRRRNEHPVRYQLLIGFSELMSASDDGEASVRRRSAGAVRWVMTWMAVAGDLASSSPPSP